MTEDAARGRSARASVTTAQAAALAGMTPAHFRSEMARERSRGRDHRMPRDQWPDGRTPLWDEAAVREWLATRPGRGRWGRR